MSRAHADVAMWARRGVKLALLVPASVGTEHTRGLFVVIYHRVGAGMAAEMDVSTDLFARQMRFLREHFDVVPLDRGLADLGAGHVPHRDQVAVTFDDGYLDVFTNAWPVLSRMEIPATVFVATAFVEGVAPAPLSRQIPSRLPPDPLTWEQLATMTATELVAVGSHSHTHPNFDTISAARAEEELATAGALIRERAGTVPQIFAYPRGIVAHGDVVVRHHQFALGADGYKNIAATFDPRAVSRTPARRSDGLFFFERRLHGMRPLEDLLYASIKRRMR